MSVRVTHLTKIFGHQRAVDDISFQVNAGEILGFLGPNGAGKSTTMKIAACYMPPSLGQVEVGGYDVTEQPKEVRRLIGYLPEHNPLYMDMFVHEYLGFTGRVRGMKGKHLKQKQEEIIALCGLTREQNKKINALSKGYRQRVGLAQALIHDPHVLILDEPTSGLDPNQLVEIRRLIKNISKNKTVIFSTHIMQEVQALCDRVVVINKGKIAADDELKKLQAEGSQQEVLVEFAEPLTSTSLLTSLAGIESCEQIGPATYRIKAGKGDDVRPRIFSYAAEHKLSLLGLKVEEHSIESVFRTLTKSEGEQ